MKSDTPFNPNAYDTYLTIEELSNKFEYLKDMDFKELSLNEELTNLNYEIISTDYQDKSYSDISDYYHLEVDEIV